MQSKIISVSELKQSFPIYYTTKNDTYDGFFSRLDFEKGSFPVVNIHETFVPLNELSDEQGIKHNYESWIIDAIDQKIYQWESFIKSHTNTFKKRVQNIFKPVPEIAYYKELIARYSPYLSRRKPLSDLLSFHLVRLDDGHLLNIPDFSLHREQELYYVEPGLSANLKLSKVVVDKIDIVAASSDTLLDFEFSYRFKGDAIPSLSASDMRYSDGLVIKVGYYQQYIFISKEEAKKHGLKVLENLRDSVQRQIDELQSF